ncbi:unnamed protein product [Bemisia tabaci]|uniref:Peptidase S1 domain-containing protein n=1 Tax=Bemisia tabaci TaxID=7038 RepID=A0A9P0AP99_BEMTA|nr:unnamed protein product [Bemisia tabaci]
MSFFSLRWIFVLCVGVSVDVLAQDFEGGAPRGSALPRRQTECAEYKKLTKAGQSESSFRDSCPQASFGVAVVGGEDAALYEFPHMVALAYKNRGRLGYYCGGTLISGKRSDVLQKVKLEVINNTLCDQLYDKERREPNRALERGIIETMLCAGKLDGGADTCQGDSGGPFGLPSPDNVCQHILVGVTSFGKFCGQENSPGVYTRVSSYLPWIENIVWNGEQ